MGKDELRRYNLWIDVDSLNKLKKLSKTDGIALSTFIRIAIKEKLERYFAERSSK